MSLTDCSINKSSHFPRSHVTASYLYFQIAKEKTIKMFMLSYLSIAAQQSEAGLTCSHYVNDIGRI